MHYCFFMNAPLVAYFGVLTINFIFYEVFEWFNCDIVLEKIKHRAQMFLMSKIFQQ